MRCTYMANQTVRNDKSHSNSRIRGQVSEHEEHGETRNEENHRQITVREMKERNGTGKEFAEQERRR